jgi:hypothetical protein
VNSLSDRGALADSGSQQVDDDERQLAAYNSYLQALGNSEPGAASNEPHAAKSRDER